MHRSFITLASRWLSCALLCLVFVAHPNLRAEETGKSLYEGNHEAYRADKNKIVDARDATLKLPAEQAACIACHRPSGLGSFEGGVAVPPIAGHLLFEAYDTATTKRYGFKNTLRVRPAYTQEQLRTLLATGRTPDGIQVSPLMPRYDFSASEVAALSTHLSSLSATRAPGVSDDKVVFATITTDDVPAADVQDLLGTLNAFVTTKNAGTRGEFGRRAQAQRKEQIMYLRHRNWELRHWQLSGAPSTWAAQLEALWAKEPVFAVLSGLSGQNWQPVHDFCTRTATPCLLPMVDMPPQKEDFYSVYFSRGFAAQAQEALTFLNAQQTAPKNKDVLLITPQDARGAQQRVLLQRVIAPLSYKLINQQDVSAMPSQTVLTLSTLPLSETHAALKGHSEQIFAVILLGGSVQNELKISANNNIQDAVSSNFRFMSASDFANSTAARNGVLRSKSWLHARGLKINNPLIASNALFVATLAVESLMHVDDKFSREYCIEKLEHNMENIPPMTAYERLSIGPQQRFASKQVQVTALSKEGAAVSQGMK